MKLFSINLENSYKKVSVSELKNQNLNLIETISVLQNLRFCKSNSIDLKRNLKDSSLYREHLIDLSECSILVKLMYSFIINDSLRNLSLYSDNIKAC